MLTPKLKNRSPHGVTSQETPLLLTSDQRVVGAWARSRQAEAGATGNAAAARAASASTRPRPQNRMIPPTNAAVDAALARRPASRVGAADRQSVHAQGRLADADRDALSILAAGADPVVEAEVVADHRDLGKRLGAVADQCSAFDCRADLAVLDQIGLGG